MKNLAWIGWLLCLLIVFDACKKENSADLSSPGISSASVVGTWELHRSSGQVTRVYSEGNGNKLIFTDTAYEQYSDGLLIKRGKYAILRDSLVNQSVCLVFPKGQFENRIIYDQNYDEPKIYYQIDNQKLTIVTGCFASGAGEFREYTRQ